MTGRPSFTLSEALAMFEKLCSKLTALQTNDEVAIDWLKVGNVQREELDLHWRMRNVVLGCCLDLRLSRVSVQALEWVSGVGSSDAERASWDVAFEKDVRRMMGVIRAGLKTPIHEWNDERELSRGLAGSNVLVVDDDMDSRRRLGRVLEASGGRVYLAANAAQAREVIHELTPSLMISQIVLPGEDGCALMESIRNLPSREKNRIPSIALDAFLQPGDLARVSRAGFDMLVTKPVQPRKLTRVAIQLTTAPIILG